MPDLAMHLLDIVYNSIRAGAHWIYITIIDSKKDDVLSCEVKDDGCGMDEAMVENVQSPFYTTRTTRDVGLGIPLFKEGALATQGSFQLTSKVGEGTTIYASYVRSHLDCPVLGDLAETLATLIQADATIEYHFTYTNDEGVFVLDTKEIKEILDGVPINEPDIIIWLKDYIREGVKS